MRVHVCINMYIYIIHIIFYIGRANRGYQNIDLGVRYTQQAAGSERVEHIPRQYSRFAYSVYIINYMYIYLWCV